MRGLHGLNYSLELDVRVVLQLGILGRVSELAARGRGRGRKQGESGWRRAIAHRQMLAFEHRHWGRETSARLVLSCRAGLHSNPGGKAVGNQARETQGVPRGDFRA